jgi:hypothetical protein
MLYVDPNDAPWTEEYRENKAYYRLQRVHSSYWDDDDNDVEYFDQLYNPIS